MEEIQFNCEREFGDGRRHGFGGCERREKTGPPMFCRSPSTCQDCCGTRQLQTFFRSVMMTTMMMSPPPLVRKQQRQYYQHNKNNDRHHYCSHQQETMSSVVVALMMIVVATGMQHGGSGLSVVSAFQQQHHLHRHHEPFLLYRRRRSSSHLSPPEAATLARRHQRREEVSAAASTASTTTTTTTTTRLYNSLKPAALPLMDAGKALARSGELLIDYTSTVELYGGGLSAAGAQIRNAGDSIAQAAASCRFKTGVELVTDELREAATCLQEAQSKLSLACQEAETDSDEDLKTRIINMIGPTSAASSALEAAGATILQRQPITEVGNQLVTAAEQFDVLATKIDELSSSASASSATTTTLDDPATISSQRMKYCSEQMKLAGQELQQGGPKPTTKTGKSWLKG